MITIKQLTWYETEDGVDFIHKGKKVYFCGIKIYESCVTKQLEELPKNKNIGYV